MDQASAHVVEIERLQWRKAKTIFPGYPLEFGLVLPILYTMTTLSMAFSKWEKKSGRVRVKEAQRKDSWNHRLMSGYVGILLVIGHGWCSASTYTFDSISYKLVEYFCSFSLKANARVTYVFPLSAYSASSLGTSEFLTSDKWTGDVWYSRIFQDTAAL